MNVVNVILNVLELNNNKPVYLGSVQQLRSWQ